jgi:hypothetical protein
MELASLPLFNTEVTISYTELICQTERAYLEESPKLLREVDRLLSIYENALRWPVACQALTNLNEIALELSALNNRWNDFSLLVFENYITPSKTSYTSSARALRRQLQSTIKVIKEIPCLQQL